MRDARIFSEQSFSAASFDRHSLAVRDMTPEEGEPFGQKGAVA